MRILITGATGQLGWELARCISLQGQILTPDRADLDLTDPAGVLAWLNNQKPDLIINPAAFTAVDLAEEQTDAAMAVNCNSPAEMANWCRKNDVGLVHYSTDYVFNGLGDAPFLESDPTGPTNVYGQSKLAGEQAIAESDCAHWIFRTSWVYSARGKNFLNTMLRLAQSHPELKVVDDQIGSPTPARMLADATALALARNSAMASDLHESKGVYHVAPRGHVSWHGFAEAIMQHRQALTGQDSPPVRAIPTSEFPTPATRPLNSRLNVERFETQFEMTLPDWQTGLANTIGDRFSLA